MLAVSAIAMTIITTCPVIAEYETIDNREYNQSRVSYSSSYLSRYQ